MTTEATRTHVTFEELTEIVVDLLVSLGTPRDEAEIVATSLSRAEIRGQRSHGVMRLPTYIKRMQAGLIKVDVPLTVVHEGLCSFTFDANAGFGHVAGTRAMEAAVTKAGTTGIAFATVRNSTHFGVTGLFAEMAADAGMIGIASSNGAARMAPYGGTKSTIGTNPLAFAIPSRAGFPLVLDLATSVAALGKVLDAQATGSPIPEGWALDSEGRPTTDAAAAVAGVLLPMAGPKGSGLSIILEVLSAVLPGASVGANAGSMYRTWDRPEDLGHFVGAISIEAFTTADRFYQDLDELIGQIRSATDQKDATILLPGELEHQREQAGRTNGIDLDQTAIAWLTESANLAGVPVPV